MGKRQVKLPGKKVVLKRIEPFDATFHTALSETLVEWSSPEDEQAFRDLWPVTGGRRSLFRNSR
jgi:hypothetical protein